MSIRFLIVRPANGSLTIVRLFMTKIGTNPFANESNGTSGSAPQCHGVQQISEEKCFKTIRQSTV
jgi:hypothetical protein